MKVKRYFIQLAVLVIMNTSFLSAQLLQTERLNTADGLSNNEVRHIFQDSYGLIWIGTGYGLNLYDGYDFKIFKNDPGNPESINSNVIWWIAEDAENNLWVATGEGISKYVRAENKFKNYDFYGNYYSSLITFIDSKGRIWASVEGENILKYNEVNDSWDKQNYDLIDSSWIYVNPTHVQTMIEDINNKLWIGSMRYGLMWYDENENIFRQAEIISEDEDGDFTTRENIITSLYSDSSGVLWITTRSGIYKYNPGLKELKTIKKYSKDKLGNWSAANCISQDQKGNVWIANNKNGCLKFEGISDDYSRIERLVQDFSREENSAMVLTRILCDRTGILWIG